MIINGVRVKPIPDFPDYYVSKAGIVWSIKSGVPRRLKFGYRGRKPKIYWGVNLCRNGVQHNRKVAWCVLTAWVSPRPKGMVICHGKKGRYDDSLGNLRWGTPQDNVKDQALHGTRAKGERHGLAKLNELKVRIIRRAYNGSPDFRLTGGQLAEVFGIDQVNIRLAAHGKTWSHVPIINNLNQ